MSFSGISPVSGNHILADAVTQAQERREQRQQEMVSLIVAQAFELGKIHHQLSLEKTRLTKEIVDLKQHIKELEISHQAEILAKEEMIHLKLHEIKELFVVLTRTTNDLCVYFPSGSKERTIKSYAEYHVMGKVYNCFREVLYGPIVRQLRWDWNRLNQNSVHHFLLKDPVVPAPVASEPSRSKLTPQTSFAEEAQTAALPELLKPIVQQIKGMQAELAILNTEKLASSKKISQLNEQQVRRIDRYVNYFNNLYDFLRPYEEKIALIESEGYTHCNCLCLVDSRESFIHRVKRLENPVNANTLRYFVVDRSGVEVPELSNNNYHKETVLKEGSTFFTHFDILTSHFFAIVEKVKALRE